MGRPSIFTPELGALICERIAAGESLVKITSDEDMPARAAVYEWLSQDASFADKYARAREDQADTYADQIVAIADEEPDPNRARVRVDARKWVAAKLKARKYGDRTTLEHEGAVVHYHVETPAIAAQPDQWLKQVASASGDLKAVPRPTS